MAQPPVEVIAPADLDDDTALAVTRLLQEAWPSPGFVEHEAVERRLREWRAAPPVSGVPPRHYVVREGDRVVAHATGGVREVWAGDRRLPVLALAGVVVVPDRRGAGYGLAVVREALRRVDDGTLPYGLWQTHEARGFYEKLGAVVVENRFVNSLNGADPEGWPWWEPFVMRYPAARPGWPEGPIDLRGPGY